MDDFFSRKTCERCHKDLRLGRTMSMFNTQCICIECAKAETKDPEFGEAVRAEIREIKRGNYNYKGLRG
jgi:hypothetical protein